MDTAYAMNVLLSNSCHNPIDDDWSEYVVELHCMTVKIIARSTGRIFDEDGNYRHSIYEIRSLEQCEEEE
jgi:hypothetical protein